MMRLIDLDELQKYPFRHSNYDEKKGNLHFVNGVESLMEYAETLPVINPEELRPRGKWIEQTARGDLVMVCSVCHCDSDLCYEQNYCPNCGAKMEV